MGAPMAMTSPTARPPQPFAEEVDERVERAAAASVGSTLAGTLFR